LASIYYEKFVFNEGNAWDSISEYIIDKFRAVFKTLYEGAR
jgi:hypothetical protein